MDTKKMNLNTSENFREGAIPKAKMVRPAKVIEPKAAKLEEPLVDPIHLEVEPGKDKAAPEAPDYEKLYKAMLAEKAEKKADVKEYPAVKAPAAPVDPWDIMVDYTMPRGGLGENQMMPIRVGDYEAYFKRGTRIKIPYPAYLVLRQTIKSEDAHAILSAELNGDHQLGDVVT